MLKISSCRKRAYDGFRFLAEEEKKLKKLE
jgi:hypothetical protein